MSIQKGGYADFSAQTLVSSAGCLWQEIRSGWIISRRWTNICFRGWTQLPKEKNSWIHFCLEILSYFNQRKDKIFSFERQQITHNLSVLFMLNLLTAAPSDIKNWTEISLYLFLQFSKETLANMYSAYIDNFLNAKDAVRTAKEAKPAFHKFLEVSVRLRKAKKRSLFLLFLLLIVFVSNLKLILTAVCQKYHPQSRFCCTFQLMQNVFNRVTAPSCGADTKCNNRLCFSSHNYLFSSSYNSKICVRTRKNRLWEIWWSNRFRGSLDTSC